MVLPAINSQQLSIFTGISLYYPAKSIAYGLTYFYLNPFPMKPRNDLKLAVLIDADNIPHKSIKGMLDEIAKLGHATIKRIYGDWTTQTVSGWKSALLEHAITPIQQYSYTRGKNSTDSAMIIDAMDILHSQKVDGFCIVSSDSDFTRLATRLRESGMLVIGIGEKKTPNPFIVACDKFIYIEIMGQREQDADDQTPATSASKSPAAARKPKPQQPAVDTIDRRTINLIKSSVEDQADDDEWAFLADVGNLLNKKKPDFDPRNYGFQKLTPLIKSLGKHFDIDERKTPNSNVKHIFVRNRK